MLAALVAVAAGWLVLAASTAIAGATPVPVTYDGEALLRGTFLGLGPVAEAYPELVYAEIEQTPENLDRIDGLLAMAQLRDPLLLDRFGSAMYSGDPEAISAAALDAMAVLDYRVVIQNNSGQGYFGADAPLAAGRPQRFDPRFERWVWLVAFTLAR